MSRRYREVYERSIRDPGAFWAEAAEGISWDRRWDTVLDASRAPFVRWFPGGILNTCYNAVDRHVERGRGKQRALIHDSPVTGKTEIVTFVELRDRVAELAGAIRSLGVGKGDRVLIYMPAVPEAVFGMLACARLGAVHSVVFGGFAPKELATRIDDARPTIILSASCGIEGTRVIPYKPLLDQAIEMAVHKPASTLILQRPQAEATLIPGRDYDWRSKVTGAAPADCVPVAATDPLYILYTSGTTGVPKGVVRDNGGHAVALQWSMTNVFATGPGEVFWAASDIGWTVGHSYIVYAPLLHGCTTVLYEGKPVGTPDPGAFWRVCAQHGVSVLFTAPTAFRAIKREDPHGSFMAAHDLSRFRLLFLAGERCDPDTLVWAQDRLGVPVIDHWWQTELGWPALANCAGLGLQPIKPGSPTRPVPGFDIRVIADDGTEMAPGQIGKIVVTLPLPPGGLPTLWNNDEGFVRSYLSQHEGYYLTGDAGYVDEDGYFYVMSRVDDIINVAGHRLSTGAVEEVLASHPDVAECAVIGAADELKGEVPVGLVVLKAGVVTAPEKVIEDLVARVRSTIGAFACFRSAVVVKALPKTRSGKILRGTMKRLADGVEYKLPATIDDPAVLTDIGERMKTIGYARPV
jgi:propionyl-CoA synthetase